MNRSCEKASAGRYFTGFFCFLAIYACVCPEHAPGQEAQKHTVQSISLLGHNALSRTELFSVMLLQEGAVFSRERLAHDIHELTQLYHSEGFLFARVDSTSVVSNAADAVDITVFLNEGKPAVIRSVTVKGNRGGNTEAILSEMESVVGYPFRQSILEQDVQMLLKGYEQIGYPFTKISIEDVQLNEGAEEFGVDILIAIDEGKAVVVSELQIQGNTVTDSSVIVREARLNPNEPFHTGLPVRVFRRLQKTGLFSSVSFPALYIREDGTAGLSVKVTEGNPNRFDGLLGYVPSSTTDESGYLTGLANVQFRNIFGTGRRLSARWQRENQSTQEISLRYFEPWVALYPVNADVGFFQRKQDSSYVRRMYDLEAEYMLSEEFRFGVSVAQHDVVPSEGLAGFTLAESHTTTVGGFLFYDSRDDAVTPSDGFLYRMDYHTGTKKSTVAQATSTSATQRFGLDFEYYLQLFDKQVLAASVHAREFRGGGTEVSDLYRLGGATTVRGYREGQFLGSRVAWSNIEYRYGVGPRSFFYLFTDVAYVSSPDLLSSGITASEQTKIGYGAGVRLDTAVGLLGVSLALGEGDTFSTAKLHLRLENEF